MKKTNIKKYKRQLPLTPQKYYLKYTAILVITQTRLKDTVNSKKRLIKRGKASNSILHESRVLFRIQFRSRSLHTRFCSRPRVMAAPNVNKGDMRRRGWNLPPFSSLRARRPELSLRGRDHYFSAG